MTPGSRGWVARSLRDWASSVGHGMALVTHLNTLAALEVVGKITRELESRGLTCSTMQCTARTEPQPFVRDVAADRSDVLFVLDVDRMLFGDDQSLSPFWINFQRETIVAHPGAQIWWMSPKGAIRFGQSLPDLARFFLFRESLTEVYVGEAQPAVTPESQWSAPVPGGNESRAEDLLARAIQAAQSGRADPARIWLELAIPAIDEFLELHLSDRAIAAFSSVSEGTGSPVDALRHAARREDVEDSRRGQIANAFRVLSWTASEMGRREEALERGEEAVAMYRELADERRQAFLPDLARSVRNLPKFLSEMGRWEEALERGEEAVAMYRELADERRQAFLPDLARSVRNLAVGLSAMGRREEALERGEEAVAMYRELADKRREAFAPDLARSLGSLNWITRKADPAASVAVLEEAIEILTPFLLRLPKVHKPLMEFLVAAYDEAVSQTPDARPDPDLLAPLLPFLDVDSNDLSPTKPN